MASSRSSAADPLADAVARALAAHLTGPGRVAVALSGGRDSVALLVPSRRCPRRGRASRSRSTSTTAFPRAPTPGRRAAPHCARRSMCRSWSGGCPSMPRIRTASRPRHGARATRRWPAPRTMPAPPRCCSRTIRTTRPRRCCCSSPAVRARMASPACRRRESTRRGLAWLRPFLGLPRSAIDAWVRDARSRVRRRRQQRVAAPSPQRAAACGRAGLCPRLPGVPRHAGPRGDAAGRRGTTDRRPRGAGSRAARRRRPAGRRRSPAIARPPGAQRAAAFPAPRGLAPALRGAARGTRRPAGVRADRCARRVRARRRALRRASRAPAAPAGRAASVRVRVARGARARAAARPAGVRRRRGCGAGGGHRREGADRRALPGRWGAPRARSRRARAARSRPGCASPGCRRGSAPRCRWSSAATCWRRSPGSASTRPSGPAPAPAATDSTGGPTPESGGRAPRVRTAGSAGTA